MQDDWIAILAEPLDVASAVKFVGSADAGGIDVFLGTTRAESHGDGRSLLALEYEAYVEMATEQLAQLVVDVRQSWPVLRCALLHRIGTVPIGQPSVLIAVATAHRAEAFEACRFLIDELKKYAAIWKREIWSDGTGTWVHPD